MKGIISRTVMLLSLVSLFNDLASELLYPVMPVYLRSIGFSIISIGILEGLTEAIAGLSKGYFGQMSDKIGKRMPFVQVGYSLTAISRLLLALFASVPAIFASRLFDRIGKGVRTAARDAILSAESPEGKKATVFSFHRAFDTIGATLGPTFALIYLWWKPNDYKGLIWFAFIPVLVAVFFTFIPKEKTIEPLEKQTPGFFTYLKYWNSATVSFKTIVIRFLVFGLINSSDVFLLLILKAKGFSDTTMIGFYIFYNLVYALASVPAGRIADAIGMEKILFIGLLLFGIVYEAITVTGNFYMLTGLLFIYGLYAACFESTSKAILTGHIKKEDAATALGFYSSLSSIASLIASTWTGIIWHIFNPQYALMFSGVVAIALAFSFLKAPRSKSFQINN